MSSVIIPYPYPELARFLRKLRRSSLLVPQTEHYCQNDVLVQSLTGIQAKCLSEILPTTYLFSKIVLVMR